MIFVPTIYFTKKFHQTQKVQCDHSYEYQHWIYTSKIGCSDKVGIVEKIADRNHNQQLKKWFKPIRCAMITFFGATNPYKKFNEAQQ